MGLSFFFLRNFLHPFQFHFYHTFLQSFHENPENLLKIGNFSSLFVVLYIGDYPFMKLVSYDGYCPAKKTTKKPLLCSFMYDGGDMEYGKKKNKIHKGL